MKKYIIVAIVFLFCGIIVGTEIITVQHDNADVLGLKIDRWQYSNKVDGADSLRYVIKYGDIVLYRGMPPPSPIIKAMLWDAIDTCGYWQAIGVTSHVIDSVRVSK